MGERERRHKSGKERVAEKGGGRRGLNEGGGVGNKFSRGRIWRLALHKEKGEKKITPAGVRNAVKIN